MAHVSSEEALIPSIRQLRCHLPRLRKAKKAHVSSEEGLGSSRWGSCHEVTEGGIKSAVIRGRFFFRNIDHLHVAARFRGIIFIHDAQLITGNRIAVLRSSRIAS